MRKAVGPEVRTRGEVRGGEGGIIDVQGGNFELDSVHCEGERVRFSSYAVGCLRPSFPIRTNVCLIDKDRRNPSSDRAPSIFSRRISHKVPSIFPSG